MSTKKEAEEIIKHLVKDGFSATCPNPECSQDFLLKSGQLFYNDQLNDQAIELYNECLEDIKERKKYLRELQSKIAKRSETSSKASNAGKILERLICSLKKFPFNRNDCRSILDPIDYIIFEGLSKKGKVDKIFFTDIKSGNARLSTRQKEIKDLVTLQKVLFKNY